MQYESSVTYGLKVMAKVKVFVQAIDANADGRTMALAHRTSRIRVPPLCTVTGKST